MLRQLPAESVHCVCTSPPFYGLRDYGTAVWQGGDPTCRHTITHYADAKHVAGVERPFRGDRSCCMKCGAERIDQQIGLEATPNLYIQRLVEVFREVSRVLRKDGTVWLNLGDSYSGSWGNYGGQNRGNGKQRAISRGSKAPQKAYDGLEGWIPPTARVAGLKPKDLMMIPARVAIALQEDGWYLRSDIIWAKRNPMPESVQDRPTKAHEHIFLLSKSKHYFYDAFAIQEESVTQDLRKPYTSAGAWEMDGRPPEQRHGGELRSARDSFKKNGSKREEAIPGQSVGTHRPDRKESEWDVLTRNKRSVWMVTVRAYKGAHYATFPPELIEPCILAGTSAYGCCEKCGAPYKRLVESTREHGLAAVAFPKPEPLDDRNGHKRLHQRLRAARAAGELHDHALGGKVEVLGWQATCKCQEAGIVPCVVLDPFVGSGTTGLVALHHQRSFIGIDLKPEYIQQAEERLKKGLTFAKKAQPTQRAEPAGRVVPPPNQMELFRNGTTANGSGKELPAKSKPRLRTKTPAQDAKR